MAFGSEMVIVPVDVPTEREVLTVTDSSKELPAEMAPAGKLTDSHVAL